MTEAAILARRAVRLFHQTTENQMPLILSDIARLVGQISQLSCSPILSAAGSLMGLITFAITWSFFFTTPGVVKWSLSTDPMAWNLTGEFLFKDIVLLCVCAVLFLASLPQTVVPSRTT